MLQPSTAICESGESSGASTPGSEKDVVMPATSAAGLTQHAARQAVMDFLKVIVLDSLPLNVTGKTAPVSELLYLGIQKNLELLRTTKLTGRRLRVESVLQQI